MNEMRERLSSQFVFLLGLITGLTVASIYLLQPLLHTVAQALHVANHDVGLIVTLTQCGYGLGIFFLIPLGDVLPKKKLIAWKLLFLILALFYTGVSGSYEGLIFGSILIGAFATTAQDIVPLAADLTPESERGSVVGKVMSGLLLGILLSRTVSGIIADLWGWRAVFGIVGFCTALAGILFYISIPNLPVKMKMRYGELLKSTFQTFFLYRDLRLTILTQGLIGIGFTAFWTNLSFFLGQPPLSWSNSQIGLFGLAGAAGAMAAPIAGRLSDRKGPYLGILSGGLIVFLSFGIMFCFSSSALVLLIGAIGFDLGAQMSLVSHQSIIYALDPAARSRINALFVACLFASFSFGSFVSVRLMEHFGWPGVLALCTFSSGLACLTVIWRYKKREKT